MDGDVVFTGSVPWAELPAHYAAGDVFAMPCRTRSRGLDVEGLGIVYLEASATGLPVVAGDSGGAPDAVREGETGYVVRGRDVAQLADRVATLLADRDLARQMGAAGRAWVETEWRWETQAVDGRPARRHHRTRLSRHCTDPAGRPAPPVRVTRSGRCRPVGPVGGSRICSRMRAAAGGPAEVPALAGVAADARGAGRPAPAVSTPSAVTVRSSAWASETSAARIRSSVRLAGSLGGAQPGHERAGQLQLVHRQVAAGTPGWSSRCRSRRWRSGRPRSASARRAAHRLPGRCPSPRSR